MNYDICRYSYVGIEGKFRITDDVEFTDTIFDVPVTYGGDLTGLSVLLTLGFRF